MDRGQSTMNGGKLLRRAVGMAKVTRQANTACRTRPLQATQPEDSPPGTGLITNSQQLAGLAAKITAADDVGRPLAVQCRLRERVRWCWHSGRGAQTYLTCPYPTYRFACHCTYPLP